MGVTAPWGHLHLCAAVSALQGGLEYALVVVRADVAQLHVLLGDSASLAPRTGHVLVHVLLDAMVKAHLFLLLALGLVHLENSTRCLAKQIASHVQICTISHFRSKRIA